MRKVILMYHSVSSPAIPGVIGSFPVSMERFKNQLMAARQQGWHFAPVSKLNEAVTHNTIYITGDDGTTDWAYNVLPWCEQEGIPTHTALITGPWQEKPVYPVAHRVQINLSIPDRDIPIPDLTPEQTEYIDKMYHYETEPRRRYLKGSCNLVLNFDQACDLLGEPDEEERKYLKARFANPEEYSQFHYAEFGAHTVTHRALDKGVEEYIYTEIEPSRKAIIAAGLKDSGYFTLPMKPMYDATVDDLVQPLKAEGYLGIFEGAGEWNQQSYIIPRIDAKNVESFLGVEIKE